MMNWPKLPSPGLVTVTSVMMLILPAQYLVSSLQGFPCTYFSFFSQCGLNHQLNVQFLAHLSCSDKVSFCDWSLSVVLLSVNF